MLPMNWRTKLAWVLYFIIFQFFDDVQDRHYDQYVDWLSQLTGHVLVQSVESIRQNGFNVERPIVPLADQLTDWSASHMPGPFC